MSEDAVSQGKYFQNAELAKMYRDVMIQVQGDTNADIEEQFTAISRYGPSIHSFLDVAGEYTLEGRTLTDLRPKCKSHVGIKTETKRILEALINHGYEAGCVAAMDPVKRRDVLSLSDTDIVFDPDADGRYLQPVEVDETDPIYARVSRTLRDLLN